MIPDEAVEAAARVLCGVTTDMWKDQPTRIKDKYRWEAIAALEAAAPHLMAREFIPTRWWRAIAPDGSLLAETSATDDFTHLDLIDNPGVTFQRLYEETPESVWRDETP